jgi:hypothetical protein
MGFQNGNDNSQEDFNIKRDASSRQRTSVTSKLSQDTSKCQYERLSKTGKTDGE